MLNRNSLYLAILIGVGGLMHGVLLAAPVEFNTVDTPPSQEEVGFVVAENTTEAETITEESQEIEAQEVNTIKDRKKTEEVKKESVRTVPFYSQFADITPPEWRKVSCGVASLAMLIDYYTDSISPDTLLQKGRANGAYISSAGWSHAGLINLAREYGLDGKTVTLYHLDMEGALAELRKTLEEGPVMVSVHYTFTPTNPIPHLVVINDVRDGLVHYNDPAEKSGGGSISIEKFQSAWKKRFIEIRPTN